MTTRAIFILTIVFIFNSCGPRTGISETQADVNSVSMTPDPNNIQYVNNVIKVGKREFLENCTDCHCGPNFRLEDPTSPCKLEYAFDNLPIDSLSHVIAFVKNSSQTKKGLRTNPFLTDERKDDKFIHEFEKTLPDSLIKTVIEYLWLGYRRTK